MRAGCLLQMEENEIVSIDQGYTEAIKYTPPPNLIAFKAFFHGPFIQTKFTWIYNHFVRVSFISIIIFNGPKAAGKPLNWMGIPSF